MNGKLLNGKPVYVALAQRKEVRRAQLEAQHAQRAAGLQAGRGIPMGQPPMYGAAPMFYAQPNQMQPQSRQGFVYPQQMMPRGVPRGPMPFGGRGGGPGYQMPPSYGMPMQQQRPARGRHGGRGGPGGRGNGAPRGNMGQQNNRNFKYTANARNQPPREAMPPHQPMPMGAPMPLPPMEPLTSAALANASPEQQKNMIGERLYPLIHNEQPELAGKITGMLLEMDNGELLHLLESPEALTSKIQEAMQVLEAHTDAEE